MSYEHHVANMSRSRSPSSRFRDPSLKLPPLVRDHPLPNRPPQLAPVRTVHQMQLEMEYDAEESENDSDRPSLPSLAEGMAQLGALSGDGSLELERGIHALCIFDPISIPASAEPRTGLAGALGHVPVVRSWGRWRWREYPDLAHPRIVEAVMIYERGFEVRPDQRCTRCRAGEGVSPQCIMIPSEARAQADSPSCSNCYYEGCASSCNAHARARKPSSDRSLGLDHEGDVLVDYMEVLDVIARLKRPPGADRDQSLATKARRIEVAALHIAQAARDWGEKIARA